MQTEVIGNCSNEQSVTRCNKMSHPLPPLPGSVQAHLINHSLYNYKGTKKSCGYKRVKKNSKVTIEATATVDVVPPETCTKIIFVGIEVQTVMHSRAAFLQI